MRGQTVKDFRGFHERLGQRRVRMDAERDVARERGHLDCDDAFGDQLARAGADDADAESELPALR